jgi:hypothetical protein
VGRALHPPARPLQDFIHFLGAIVFVMAMQGFVVVVAI